MALWLWNRANIIWSCCFKTNWRSFEKKLWFCRRNTIHVPTIHGRIRGEAQHRTDSVNILRSAHCCRWYDVMLGKHFLHRWFQVCVRFFFVNIKRWFCTTNWMTVELLCYGAFLMRLLCFERNLNEFFFVFDLLAD